MEKSVILVQADLCLFPLSTSPLLIKVRFFSGYNSWLMKSRGLLAYVSKKNHITNFSVYVQCWRMKTHYSCISITPILLSYKQKQKLHMAYDFLRTTCSKIRACYVTHGLTGDLIFKPQDRQASLASESQSVAPGPVTRVSPGTLGMQTPETKLAGTCSNILLLTSPFMTLCHLWLLTFS